MSAVSRSWPLSFSFYQSDSNAMTLFNFNIYTTILTANCSRTIEVRLEAVEGLASDPLNSVVNKMATWYISNSMFQCCRLIYYTSCLPVLLLCIVSASLTNSRVQSIQVVLLLLLWDFITLFLLAGVALLWFLAPRDGINYIILCMRLCVAGSAENHPCKHWDNGTLCAWNEMWVRPRGRIVFDCNHALEMVV